MTFWQRLWRAQLAGLISLAAFAAFLARLFVLVGIVAGPSVLFMTHKLYQRWSERPLEH